MRLKIENYTKITGWELDGWMIESVVESENYYSFLCRKLGPLAPYGQISNIRLEREGVQEWNGWKFRFWRPANNATYNQVTADWFGDMRNAAKVIETELKNGLHK